MGLSGARSPRADAFTSRDAIVTASGYVAATISAAALVALVAALVSLGWKDFAFAVGANGPLGAAAPLGVSAVVVLIALPVTFVMGVFAAACASDVVIGGFAYRLVCEALKWFLGIPPLVVGVCLFIVAASIGRSSIVAVSALALIVLNLPNATARLSQAFASVSARSREAAAAAGASPVTIFAGLVLPQTRWALAAATLGITGQMIGETSAVVVAIDSRAGVQPLPAAIWHLASNQSLAQTEAASCMLLVLICGVCLAASKACARNHAEEVNEES